MSQVSKKQDFTITFMREPDDCPDLSHLGEFTNSPTFPFYDRREGVVVHNDTEWEALGDRPHGREYLYVHDFQCPEDDKAIEQDARRLEDYGNGWGMDVLTCTVTLDGHEFGSACLGGVESDCDDATIEQMQGELQDEAVKEAEENFKAFMAKHGEG